MDTLKLRQALAMLNGFSQSLPKGDIEEKYVTLYHKTLDDIQAQINKDFEYFRIPSNELNPHLVSVDFGRYGRGPANKTYSDKRYCDRARFLMALRGAINFINAQTQDFGATTIPLVDPPKQ